MKDILYVGPSWTVKSWDLTETNQSITNLNKLLNLKGIDLSECGASNLSCLDKIHNYQQHYDAIFWVYCEPILDAERLKISRKSELIQTENFWELRIDANQQILDRISKLNIPVAIVGSHSDIFNCDYDNIFVIDRSWQRYLDSIINQNYHDDEKLKDGWGAEILHNYIHEYPEITPSKFIVDKISKTFFNWSLLMKHGLWFDTHPTRLGNELFAKEINPKVQRWLDSL